jgi:hypothetical protein
MKKIIDRVEYRNSALKFKFGSSGVRVYQKENKRSRRFSSANVKRNLTPVQRKIFFVAEDFLSSSLDSPFQSTNAYSGPLELKMLVYFTALWSILWSFGVICGHMIYFMAIWYFYGWLFGL